MQKQKHCKNKGIGVPILLEGTVYNMSPGAAKLGQNVYYRSKCLLDPLGVHYKNIHLYM